VIKAKKRRLGRAQKIIGDYCLLAGSPADANAHYTTAIDLARLTGDVFWHAGALEGSVCALVVSVHVSTLGFGIKSIPVILIMRQIDSWHFGYCILLVIVSSCK
jgi:hypothetical protein